MSGVDEAARITRPDTPVSRQEPGVAPKTEIREVLHMVKSRREALKSGGGMTLMALLVAAGWLKPGDAAAQAWNKSAFEAKSMDEAMKAFGGGAPAQSKDVAFVSTPDIAENGAVVPISITSSIPKTESIAILIEKNPNMLAASFDIPAGHRAR